MIKKARVRFPHTIQSGWFRKYKLVDQGYDVMTYDGITTIKADCVYRRCAFITAKTMLDNFEVLVTLPTLFGVSADNVCGKIIGWDNEGCKDIKVSFFIGMGKE